MIFTSKRLIHNKGKMYEISEVIANVEFSEGDLIELRSILRNSLENEWARLLLQMINEALKK